jgi:hypothetical protein
VDWNQPLKYDEDDAKKENLNAKFLFVMSKRREQNYILLQR